VSQPLGDGWLLVAPADAAHLVRFVRAGALSFRERRNLSNREADLLMAVEQAAYAARRSAIGTATTTLRLDVGESLVTVPDAAQALHVSDSYVRRLCRARALDAQRDGRDWRIEADSLAAYALRRGDTA